MKEEIWTMKDGTKIAVGDMSESHVRNALRMVIRVHRRKQKALVKLMALKRALRQARDHDFEMTEGEMQDMLSNEAYNRLSDPSCYFPLLEGGIHGGPDTAARYDPRR